MVSAGKRKGVPPVGLIGFEGIRDIFRQNIIVGLIVLILVGLIGFEGIRDIFRQNITGGIKNINAGYFKKNKQG